MTGQYNPDKNILYTQNDQKLMDGWIGAEIHYGSVLNQPR